MIRLALACLLVVIAASPTVASTRHIRWPGPYPVTIAAVLDGDSIVVELDGDCPFGCRESTSGKEIITVRLAGIDAPEIHACRSEPRPSCAACPEEIDLARRAKAAVGEMVRSVDGVRIVVLSPDKYSGRVVGDLQVMRNGAWLSISEEMLKRGLAVPYDGGRKTKPWCAK